MNTIHHKTDVTGIDVTTYIHQKADLIKRTLKKRTL